MARYRYRTSTAGVAAVGRSLYFLPDLFINRTDAILCISATTRQPDQCVA